MRRTILKYFRKAFLTAVFAMVLGAGCSELVAPGEPLYEVRGFSVVANEIRARIDITNPGKWTIDVAIGNACQDLYQVELSEAGGAFEPVWRTLPSVSGLGGCKSGPMAFRLGTNDILTLRVLQPLDEVLGDSLPEGRYDSRAVIPQRYPMERRIELPLGEVTLTR